MATKKITALNFAPNIQDNDVLIMSSVDDITSYKISMSNVLAYTTDALFVQGQAASELLDAIKTVDGSGSGLDADTLDGVQATELVSSSGDTISGQLVIEDTNGVAALSVLDSSTSAASPYSLFRGSRADGNSHFEGKLALAKWRTDAAIGGTGGSKLGQIMFGGNHTDSTETNILYGASITGQAGGTWSSSTAMPTDLVFNTGSTGVLPGALTTAGAERLRITSAGLVGIGTSSPAEKLDVRAAGTTTIGVRTTDTSGANVARVRVDYTGGGGGAASQVDLRAGDAYTYLVSPTNTPMLFGTNNTERLRITSAGSVGIGTSTPEAALEIVGSVQLSDSLVLDNGNSTTAKITIQGGGNLVLEADSEDVVAASTISLLIDGSEVVDFTNAGYQRLNVANYPNGGICVAGATDGILRMSGGSNPLNNGMNLSLVGPDNTNTNKFLVRDGVSNIISYLHTDEWIFYNSGTEAMRIDASGNVGIGTSSPDVPLEVAGAIKSTSLNPTLVLEDTNEAVDEKIWTIKTTAGSLSVSAVTDVGVGGGAYWTFDRSGNNVQKLVGYRTGVERLDLSNWDNHLMFSEAESSIGTKTNHPVLFKNNNIERMRIDASGNVGIGTSSPATKLDVREDGLSSGSKRAAFHSDVSSVSNFLATDPVLFLNNAGAGDTGIHFRANASDYSIRATDSGELLFEDDAIERMRIDASGNVGIGTSSPATKLHVSSDSVPAILESSTSEGFLVFRNNTVTGNQVRFGVAGSDLVLNTATAERMRITSAGNVGIGTDTPSEKLEIDGNVLLQSDIGNNLFLSTYVGNTNSSNLRFRKARGGIVGPSAIVANDILGRIYFDGYDGAAYQNGASIVAAARATTGTLNTEMLYDADAHIFRDDTASEKMRVASSGDVGIGTSSPATKLDVNGVITSASQVAFKTFLTDNSSVNSSTTFTEYSVFNATPVISNGGFTAATSGITVPTSGLYMVSFTCYFNSLVIRANVGVSLGINNVRQPGISASDYIRGGVSAHLEASTGMSTILDLDASDVITLFFSQVGETGTVDLVGAESFISIHKLV